MSIKINNSTESCGISNQSYNCVQAVWTNPFCFLFLYSEKKTEKFISTPVNNCWPGDHTTLLQFKSDNHIIVYDCPGFKIPSVQINLEDLFHNRQIQLFAQKIQCIGLQILEEFSVVRYLQKKNRDKGHGYGHLYRIVKLNTSTNVFDYSTVGLSANINGITSLISQKNYLFSYH